MKNSKNQPLRSLASHAVVILTMFFLPRITHAQDFWGNWDNDNRFNHDDWGVVLTFDMHFPNESVADWNYPSLWTGKTDILNILDAAGATGTFFVSGFEAALPGDSPNWLLSELLGRGNELAWHSRRHLSFPQWQTQSCTTGWPAAWNFVEQEIKCDVTNYENARVSWWPTVGEITSYAYPYTAGDAMVDWFLREYMGHVRGSAGGAGPSVSTSTIADSFQLRAYWLDNFNLCDTALSPLHVGCGEEIDVKDRIGPVTQVINNAFAKGVAEGFANRETVILAAHHLTDSRDPTQPNPSDPNLPDLPLGATRVDTLEAVLEHINCLKNGGTPNGIYCSPATSPSDSNWVVYHKFRDLPRPASAAPLTALPQGSGCEQPIDQFCSGQ